MTGLQAVRAAMGTVALVAGLMAGLAVHAAEPAGPQQLPPDAPLGQSLDGQLKRLSDLGGKPAVVFFWASWCPYCRNELPVLEGLQQAAGAERLQVVAVNVEEKAVFRKIHKSLASSLKLTLTYDPDQSSAKAFSKPGSLPYTVVLRGDGSVAATQRGWGGDSQEFLLAHVNAVMREHAAGGAAPAGQ